MSDTPRNPLEGLNELSLGPAWARDKAEKSAKKTQYSEEREYKPRREGGRDDRRGGNDRSERRQGSGDRSQGGGDRRESGSGGRRNFDNSRGRREEFREEIAPAEGVTVTLIPEKQAIQAICKEVHQVARVYPLFDIAQTILAERNRSRATIEINEKQQPFYRCKIEDAVFLTKEEALRHFLQADWRHRYIEESTVEVDPPKGSFQSVARCGISGEWLGPPNFHSYQTNLRRLHRERFANMPFEVYSAKVRTERSEEAVNEWLESMKTQTRWRILSDEETAAVAADSIRQAESPPKHEELPADSAPKADTVTEEAVTKEAPANPVEASEETTPPVEETEIDTATHEAPQETAEVETTSSEEPQKETPVTEEITWFTDRAEIERAIVNEVLEKVFHATRKTKVSAAIIGKKLSPGLLVRLKGTGNHHRKHPAILIPVVCKALESEHMPVFKRKGKLFTGPARPQGLAADAILAPRPGEMVKWIRENTPAKLEGLWKAVLPEGATAPPAEYAADLFWLLQQGHILLYTDDILVVQEITKPQEKKPKQPKKKAAKQTDPKAASATKGKAKVAVTEKTPTAEAAPASCEEPKKEEAPVEIITEAIKSIAVTVSEAASQLIDKVAEATPVEPTPESEAVSKTAEDAAPVAKPVEFISEEITDAVETVSVKTSEAQAIKASEPAPSAEPEPEVKPTEEPLP